MSDDIIKEQEQMMTEFRNRFPNAITIEDTMRQMILMSDEIERLRAEVSRLTLLANLWESEFNAAVDALTGKAVRGE